MAGRRSYEEELSFIEKIDENRYLIKKGFVKNMKVPGMYYSNSKLNEGILEELRVHAENPGAGGFIPAVKQVANVASLPGIVKYSMGMPDIHSGYGFAIGNVAAFDTEDPESVVSPGGVGFDINCGMRLIRTNLLEEDIASVKEELVQEMYDLIPVGVGAEGIRVSHHELEEILVTRGNKISSVDSLLSAGKKEGIDWAIKHGYAWKEDKQHCEENGRLQAADPSKVSDRAKKRGLTQVGTLGAGNHYAEIQVVEEVYDEEAAKVMGLFKGQVCIYIHSGSRGLGHQVCTDYLSVMERAMAVQNIKLNDKQLACTRINTKEGQNYLAAMAAAANYAWVNRQCMTHNVRQSFSKVMGKSAKELEMHLVYDVCHNVAKMEDHVVDGKQKKLLVHRKGSTRAFPPHHPAIPADYQEIGQPVLIGGTMAYVLTGTQKGMEETFGTTCHGAGRVLSRHAARKELSPQDVLSAMKAKGISIRVRSPKLVMEEAALAYKDATEVVKVCHDAGISKLCVKLKPVGVIKG